MNAKLKKTLFGTMAILLLTACAAQKGTRTQRTAASAIAISALDAGCYVVEIDRLYTPDGKAIDIVGSRMVIRKDQGSIELSPELFRLQPYRRLSDLQASYDVLTGESSVSKKATGNSA